MVQSAEALRGWPIRCAGLEVVMTRAKLSVQCCFRGGDRGAQCSVGADREHSVRTQWPVIPALPYPSQYGADATSGRVGHSAVSSHRSAEIVGVVDVLMGHDMLSGGSVEAGGDGIWTNRPRAIWRMRPRARWRSDSLPRPSARGLARYGECTPYRGLP